VKQVLVVLIGIVGVLATPLRGSTGATAVAFEVALADWKLTTSYLLEVLPAGVAASTATAITSVGLGRPSPDSAGRIQVSLNGALDSLPAGNYQATVRAIGSNGSRSARSAPSTFSMLGSTSPTEPRPPGGVIIIGGGDGEDSEDLPPPNSQEPAEVLIYAADVVRTDLQGAWEKDSTSSAAKGIYLWHPNRGATKVEASASPTHYVDIKFRAQGKVPYHLWIRMRAESNHYNNDSVSVQFSRSLDASGAAAYRIGTSSALSVILEDARDMGVEGWGWTDSSYTAGLGPHIMFAADGEQTIRIQAREDGAMIDQIVLSSVRYLTRRPGATKNDKTILSR
jgi:hypothetical protein